MTVDISNVNNVDSGHECNHSHHGKSKNIIAGLLPRHKHDDGRDYIGINGECLRAEHLLCFLDTGEWPEGIGSMTKTTCPDCGAAVGALHSPGCDVERCPRCGGQAISCGCTYDFSRRMTWTGMWPGEEEARKFGWFAKSVPGTGWVRCAADDPKARPDVNRLFTDARWDAASRQWVLK